MATQKQIEANRRNSQKSTGPRTPEGKAVSRFNSLKSGIYAELEYIKGESPQDYAELAAAFHAQYQPSNPAECALVDILISTEWNMRRCRRLEAQMYEVETQRLLFDESGKWGGNNCEAYLENLEVFSRLQRRLQTLERSFRQTYELLERRPTPSSPVEIVIPPLFASPAPIGFVPPPDPPAAPAPHPRPPAPASGPAPVSQNQNRLRSVKHYRRLRAARATGLAQPVEVLI